MTAKKIYKILIADDEYWTREKLCHMIAWEKYSLECLEPAKDGEEVLERLADEQVDILITDINMPFVNGVELLSKLKESYPEVVAFVISGYDDFDYVKESFMSGSVNYLVKPVTKIDLVNAIVKALQIIGERENEKLQLLKAASLIQDREYSQLITERKAPYVPGISNNNGMEPAGLSFMMIKIHNLHILDKCSRSDKNLLSYKIKKEISRLSRDENAVVFNHIYRSNEFIMITSKGEKELMRTAERIRIFFQKYQDVCLTFCITAPSYSIDSVDRAYREAVTLLMTRKFQKIDEIIVSGGQPGSQKMASHFNGEQEKQLKRALKSGNEELAAKTVLEESGLSRCAEKGWTYIEVKQTVKRLMNIFADFAAEAFGNKGLADIENLSDSVDKAVEYLDEQQVCAALLDTIDYLAPESRTSPNATMKGIVREVAEYIDAHYYEELSLVSLAADFHVESSYLSKVFRQEIGETLILYITRKRMEKAKNYMRNSETNLTEIAFMVGYDDYTYFSRVFKKNTGVSPREYRNRCLEGN